MASELSWEACKAEATSLFKAKDYTGAQRLYGEALQLLHSSSSSDQDLVSDKDARAVLHSNQAECFLKMSDFQAAFDMAQKALELDDKHVKSWFRKAKALKGLERFAEGMVAIQQLLRVDPGNQSAFLLAQEINTKRLKSSAGLKEAFEQKINAYRTLESSDKNTGKQRIIAELLNALRDSKDLEVFVAGNGIQAFWDMALNEKDQTALHFLTIITSMHELVATTLVRGQPQMLPKLQLFRQMQDPNLTKQAIHLSIQISKWPNFFVGDDTAIDDLMSFWSLGLQQQNQDDGSSQLLLSFSAINSWLTATSYPSAEQKMEVVRSRAVWFFSKSEGMETLVQLTNSMSSVTRASAMVGNIAHAFINSLDELKQMLSSILNGEACPDKVKAILVAGLFLGTPEVGAWAAEQLPGPVLLSLFQDHGDPCGQLAGAELASSACLTAAGRKWLGDRLPQLPELAARVAAPLARLRLQACLSKLALAGAAEGEGGGGADARRALRDRTRPLVAAALEALAGAERAQGGGEAYLPENGSRPPAEAVEVFESAVEILCSAIHQPSVKALVAAQAPLLVDFSKRLGRGTVEMEGEGGGRRIPSAPLGPAAYGLAYLYVHVTTTNKQLQKEALEEKEVPPEEYEQLQKLAASAASGAKTLGEINAPEEDETSEDASDRIRRLVAAGVVGSLAALCGSVGKEGACDGEEAPRPAETTLQQVATALRHLSTEEGVRGALLQQGAGRLCLRLAQPDGGGGGGGQQERRPPAAAAAARRRLEAAHALAKLLVTTNPHLLPEEERLGAVGPLLAAVAAPAAGHLARFEALLALTNLLSTGAAARGLAAARGAVAHLARAQFSAHELVRRAATEALCNMAHEPAALRHLATRDGARLAVALACDLEGDRPTAAAAAGTLAMAVGRPGPEGRACAEAFLAAGLLGPEGLPALVAGGDRDLLVRAAAAAHGVAGDARLRAAHAAGLARVAAAARARLGALLGPEGGAPPPPPPAALGAAEAPDEGGRQGEVAEVLRQLLALGVG